VSESLDTGKGGSGPFDELRALADPPTRGAGIEALIEELEGGSGRTGTGFGVA